MASQSQAAITFNFNYTDAAGIGFNAAGATGADRRAGLYAAAGILNNYLGNYTATIDINVNGSVTNNNVLASASSNYNLAFPGNGFGVRGDVMTKILGGADPDAGMEDGNVNWNFEDFDWAPGNTIGAGQFDLISTAAHELTHALGFSAFISQNGDSPYGDTPGTASAWSPFAQFMADSTGSIINGAFELDGARWNAALIGGSNNGLFFNGANAMAAFGGLAVPLYSPTTFEPGSSASHLDTDFFTGLNAQMMNHSGAPTGVLDIRAYSAIEIGILKDIGYSLIIPAPGTGLILAGAGLFAARRRRA